MNNNPNGKTKSNDFVILKINSRRKTRKVIAT